MRLVLGTILGVVAWFAVVIGVSFALKEFAPAVAAALNTHATTTALAERLAIGFAGSLVSGLIAALMSRTRAPLVAGTVLLLFWGTYHVTVIWNQFPLWYHLTFFASLPLLSFAGGALAPRRR